MSPHLLFFQRWTPTDWTAGATVATGIFTAAMAYLTRRAVRSANRASQAAEESVRATERLAQATEQLAQRDTDLLRLEVAPHVVASFQGSGTGPDTHLYGQWGLKNVGRGVALTFEFNAPEALPGSTCDQLPSYLEPGAEYTVWFRCDISSSVSEAQRFVGETGPRLISYHDVNGTRYTVEAP